MRNRTNRSIGVSVSVLALCAAITSGCGAARPSKYYELTVPGDMAPATDPKRASGDACCSGR